MYEGNEGDDDEGSSVETVRNCTKDKERVSTREGKYFEDWSLCSCFEIVLLFSNIGLFVAMQVM